MSVAAAIITGITSIAGPIIGGIFQSKQLDKGEAASKKQYLGELAENRRRFDTETGLARENLSLSRKNAAESKRQFDLSYGLKKDELDMTKGQVARDVFRDQVTNLTGILDKNEALKNLYINRLNGLRN